MSVVHFRQTMSNLTICQSIMFLLPFINIAILPRELRSTFRVLPQKGLKCPLAALPFPVRLRFTHGDNHALSPPVKSLDAHS